MESVLHGCGVCVPWVCSLRYIGVESALLASPGSVLNVECCSTKCAIYYVKCTHDVFNKNIEITAQCVKYVITGMDLKIILIETRYNPILSKMP